MATQTNKPEAQKSYDDKYDKALDYLRVIKGRMASHKKRQQLQPSNWGYAGDMARIADDLKNIVEYLKPQS